MAPTFTGKVYIVTSTFVAIVTDKPNAVAQHLDDPTEAELIFYVCPKTRIPKSLRFESRVRFTLKPKGKQQPFDHIRTLTKI